MTTAKERVGTSNPLWSPSHKESDTTVKEAPWNTVGLPVTQTHVKKAIQEFESRIKQESKVTKKAEKDDLVDSTEIARTRMMWKQREQGAVEYRTDFYPTPDEDIKNSGENVIILKLEELPKVKKKNAKVQTTHFSEPLDAFQILRPFFNYERNWNNFKQLFGSPEITLRGSVPDIDSKIPRIKTERICYKCKRVIPVTNCDCEEYLNRTPVADVDPQRSRTNFFGNSGSYALRCNLFSQNHTNSVRKVYLTPDVQDSIKVSKKPSFEDFVAKKKTFLKQKNTRNLLTADMYW